ncbi:MAG: hypothetical protein R2788_08400 [Saprospiraceae bacterium]
MLSFLSNLLSAQMSRTLDFILAHSHNDYEQKKPLYTALEHGFNSIEIDIIRYGNQLIVSHDNKDLPNKPNIQDLYLNPLKKHLNENNEINIWLLIDIKEYDDQVLDVLHDLITEYEPLFKKRYSSEKEKPLQILLSGDLPRQEIMENDTYVFFFLDGRVDDMGKRYDSTLMPLVSSNFSHHTKWTGKEKMDKKEFEAVAAIVKAVQAENKKIRFWATPDKKRVWKKLQRLGVDVIGVDHIEQFDRFNSKYSNLKEVK